MQAEQLASDTWKTSKRRVKNETDYICFIVIRRFFLCRDIRTVLQVITPFRATCSGGIFNSQQVVALQNVFSNTPWNHLQICIVSEEKKYFQNPISIEAKKLRYRSGEKSFSQGVNFWRLFQQPNIGGKFFWKWVYELPFPAGTSERIKFFSNTRKNSLSHW